MTSPWRKLDSALSAIYQSWREVQEKGLARAGFVHPDIRQGAQGAQIKLRYEGSLAEIERAGFETTSRGPRPGNAFGVVRFKDLERIAAHPGVAHLIYGREDRPRLNHSIRFVHADVLRTYHDNDYGGFSGRGVVVAVLDTGLDIGHDFLQQLRASDGDERRTRILRIWDPGLIPGSGESSPRSELLNGGTTYGVEYTEQQINDTLNGRGSVRVRHRDCSGHGTHVASIAAGNGGSAQRYVGMAPLAYIIGVKMLYLEHRPMVRDIVMSYKQLFADALDYVYNVVRLDLGDRRVVINYSIGDDQGPHDGLSQKEEDLNHYLADDDRRIFVAAAGNAGGAGSKAKMTVPAFGVREVRLPIILRDDREASSMTDYDYCSVQETASYPMQTEIWYGAPPASPVSGTLRIDGVPDSISIPEIGRETQATAYGQGQMYKLTHGRDVGEAGGILAIRNFIRLEIFPFRNQYHMRDGRYDFTLTGAPGQVLYAWGASGAHGLIEMRPAEDSLFTSLFDAAGEIDSPAGAANVIAVANFSEQAHAPAASTSRGPLTVYDPAGPPRPDKPDLAAPGRAIHAAHSHFSVQPGSCVTLPRRDDQTPKGGTSMAAPHVAGLVALMLEKNPTLTRAEVRGAFRVRAETSGNPLVLGSGVIDAQATLAAVAAP